MQKLFRIYIVLQCVFIVASTLLGIYTMPAYSDAVTFWAGVGNLGEYQKSMLGLALVPLGFAIIFSLRAFKQPQQFNPAAWATGLSILLIYSFNSWTFYVYLLAIAVCLYFAFTMKPKVTKVKLSTKQSLLK